MVERHVQAVLERALAAHGGENLWRGLDGLEAQLSASGFLFSAKGRLPLRHMRMWASATEPRFTFFDYLQPGWRGERIAAVFPPDIPTHSRRQVFYFDGQGLLTRLDYTAEVVGGWARAAHLCEDYRGFDGLKAATKRRVWPILFGAKPMPFPNLVALDIDEIRPVRI
jgi:hypothetical protein